MDDWKQWMQVSIGDDFDGSNASLCDEQVLELDTDELEEGSDKQLY